MRRLVQRSLRNAKANTRPRPTPPHHTLRSSASHKSATQFYSKPHSTLSDASKKPSSPPDSAAKAAAKAAPSPPSSSTSFNDEATAAAELLHFGAFVAFVSNYVASITQCVGPSMLPTVGQHGDVMLTVPAPTYLHLLPTQSIKDQVVIAVSPSDPSSTVCKRIVGLPGESVVVRPPPHRSRAIRFGGASSSGRASSSADDGGSYTLKLPRGHVWLQGDNAADSTDSRVYGPVPLALIKSVVVMRLWPFSNAGFLPAPPATESARPADVAQATAVSPSVSTPARAPNDCEYSEGRVGAALADGTAERRDGLDEALAALVVLEVLAARLESHGGTLGGECRSETEMALASLSRAVSSRN